MYDFVKRCIDIVLATVGLLIFLPLLIPLAIVIKLDSKGPLFADTPPRVGKDGRPFRMFKLRSMINNAHLLLQTDPAYAAYRESVKRNIGEKIPNDPRITKVGKYLRKYSVDEMPQLINVLRGEMSVVGPRPYYMQELDDYQKLYDTPEVRDLIKKAISAKPGITGGWQVSGRSNIPFDRRLHIDAQYACKKSLWQDILILLKTPKVILLGRGAQ